MKYNYAFCDYAEGMSKAVVIYPETHPEYNYTCLVPLHHFGKYDEYAKTQEQRQVNEDIRAKAWAKAAIIAKALEESGE